MFPKFTPFTFELEIKILLGWDWCNSLTGIRVKNYNSKEVGSFNTIRVKFGNV